MGLTILLQGQDITDFVDESTISINSVLGQGQGVGGQGTGSATTANFLTDLGPIKSALGAGQALPATYSQIILDDSPAGYWRMDDPVSAQDMSGNGQNGTIENGPLTIVPGATGDRNAGWETDGAARILLPVAMNPVSNFVLQALVRIRDADSHGPILNFGSGSNGYGLGIGDATDWTSPGTEVVVRLGSTFSTAAVQIPDDGQWHSIAIRVSGSSLDFFRDSVLAASVGLPVITAPTGQGYIGYDGTTTATGIDIDEVAGFATALGNSRFSVQYGAITTGPVLVRGGEIIVQDANGTAIFGGWVNEFEDASDALTVHTILDCVDYLEGLDRIEVNEVFTGSDDIAMIRFVMTNYAPDVDLSDIPATGTYPFQKRYIRAKSVKEALIGIATITGYAIWVTPDNKLEYKPPTDVSTAPFTLSDEPDFSASFGYDILNHTLDDSATINRVTFYGGQQESDDFDQDLSVQANGVNRVLLSAYYPHDASDGAIHVIQNSIEQAVGSPFDSGASGKLKRDGGTSDVLVNRDAKTLTFNNAPLKTDTLIFRYRYTTPLRIEVTDRASFAFFGKWYDGKLDDSSVLDAETAVQRARVLLSEQAYGLESLKIETHTGGLQAGQLLHITNELRGIDQTYLIQSVTVDPEGAGFFRYTVSLGAWNWNLIDLLYSITKRAGVQDDSTEEDTSVVQAEEVAESVTVTDSVTLTTTTTGAYYCGHCYCGFATVTF